MHPMALYSAVLVAALYKAATLLPEPTIFETSTHECGQQPLVPRPMTATLQGALARSSARMSISFHFMVCITLPLIQAQGMAAGPLLCDYGSHALQVMRVPRSHVIYIGSSTIPTVLH